ncbi:MAG TPA: glycosyltransferase family 87 protein [Phenylobacterium sp.]
MPRALTQVLDLPWLHARRATAWVRILAVMSLAVSLGWIALSRGGVDPSGKPLGTDFLCFWSASRLLLAGAPASAVYDAARLGAMETASFPGVDFTAFPYPPSFLLFCLPLGLLPYLAALAAWLGATGFAYWRVVRAWLGQAKGLALPVLAFPAVLINAGHGQNGFLTTALFGGGALFLRRRPFVAGVCLGLLAFKPHLGLLIPVALIASRNGRAFAGAAVAVLGLAAASVLTFGPDPWQAYPAALSTMRLNVEQGLLATEKLQTLFATLRLWGAPLPLAYAAQAVSGVAAAAAVGIFAWRRADSPALGPVLIAASLIVSPYLLDYDLVLAAVPLAWLLADGQARGFRPGDKAVMLAAYVLPLVSRLLAMNAGLAIGPFVLAALLAVTFRRGWMGDGAEASGVRR